MKKIVVALGGNALGDSVKEQIEKVEYVAKTLVELIKQGHKLVITHGNGPQVGMISNALNGSEENGVFPLPECTSMSQGYIGYHMQQALQNELRKNNINKQAVALVSQVVVDEQDAAFMNPTKPIGPFLTLEEGKMLELTGEKIMEDSGRGYRKVVASPTPKSLVEKQALLQLLENEMLPIVAGGGGVPVIDTGSSYRGVEAVIDKDATAGMLAEEIDADILFVLTAVEQVALNFGKENEKFLANVSVEEMETYAAEGHFAPGSMLPKVEAAINFASKKAARVAIITSLEAVASGVNGTSGTIIKL